MPGLWNRLTKREEANDPAAGGDESLTVGANESVAEAVAPGRTGPTVDVLYSAAGNSADQAPPAPPTSGSTSVGNELGTGNVTDSERSTPVLLEEGEGRVHPAEDAPDASVADPGIDGDIEELLEL